MQIPLSWQKFTIVSKERPRLLLSMFLWKFSKFIPDCTVSPQRTIRSHHYENLKSHLCFNIHKLWNL